MYRFDESDPRFLVVYTGDVEETPADYIQFTHYWSTWLDRNTPFGVILVTEPHEHTEDRDGEAEIMRIINDFRRDYRERTAQLSVAFARVFTPEMLQPYLEKDPNLWEQWQEATERYAQYNWGIPGKGFTSISDAKAWILEQFNRERSIDDSEILVEPVINKRIGLFYGSSTGTTEYITDKFLAAWQQAGMEELVPVNIGNVKNATQLLGFDYLILGIPTWNIGQLQDDWEIFFPQLDQLDFNGKKIAIFGVGDQYGYIDNFLDAVGILGQKLLERGAELVGSYYDADYKFRTSKAFVNGKFMGLGIDEVCQPKLTDARIERWVDQIIGEFALQPHIA